MSAAVPMDPTPAECYAKLAVRYNLPDLGFSFEHRGTAYLIYGAIPGHTHVVIRRVRDGTLHVYTAAHLRRLLGV